MWKEGDDTYPVGFARPPRETRFCKGKSGNPKGRPRKAKPEPAVDLEESALETTLRQLLARKFVVKDGVSSKTITGLEALLHAQFQSATKGNQLALRNILEASAELERRDRARLQAEEAAKHERFEAILRWKARRIQEWADAEREGKEPEVYWPHPDDILIDKQARTYRVRGPLSDAEAPIYQHIAALRSQFACEVSIELRQRGKTADNRLSAYGHIWRSYDSMLPLMWQYGAAADRIRLSIEMLSMREVKAAAREYEAEARYWHKIAFPFGEKIRFDPDVRKVLEPIVARLGFKSIRAYERHLEQESGNPPRPKTPAVIRQVLAERMEEWG
jgi:hypothetical protein